MKEFEIEILKSIYEKSYSEVINYENLYHTFCEYSKNIRFLENDLHDYILREMGDGFDLIIQDGSNYIKLSIVIYDDIGKEIIVKYIDNNFVKINKLSNNAIVNNLNHEGHIKLDLVDSNSLSYDDLLESIKENDTCDYSILRVCTIHEKGASYFLESFIISVSANILTITVEKIIQYFKNKNENPLIRIDKFFINRNIIKNFSKISNINLKNFHLSGFEKREDEKYDIELRSNKKVIYITLDKNMNIEKFRERNIY